MSTNPALQLYSAGHLSCPPFFHLIQARQLQYQNGDAHRTTYFLPNYPILQLYLPQQLDFYLASKSHCSSADNMNNMNIRLKLGVQLLRCNRVLPSLYFSNISCLELQHTHLFHRARLYRLRYVQETGQYEGHHPMQNVPHGKKGMFPSLDNLPNLRKHYNKMTVPETAMSRHLWTLLMHLPIPAAGLLSSARRVPMTRSVFSFCLSFFYFCDRCILTF